MKSVFKREFFSAFHRLYGYIAVGVMMLMAAILFTAYNLLYTTESISSVCAGMSVVCALVIPVIAINSFPSRKKEDTDSVYDMMPVGSRDVVLGKYFAALALVMLPNALIACYSVFAGFFGSIDHMASYNSLLGLVLFEAAWLAVCMLIAGVSCSRVVAYAVSYAVGVAWYFLAIVSVLIPTTRVASLIGFAVCAVIIGVLLWFATRSIVAALVSCIALGALLAVGYLVFPDSFPGLLEAFIDEFSIFAHFNSFSYGLFDVESIIFFLALTCLCVFLTWRAYEKKQLHKEKRPCLSLKKVTGVGLATLLVASTLAVTCAAAVVPDRFTVFDATAAGKSSVSDEAKEFLSELDKNVTVYLLEPTGLEDYELYLERLCASSDRLTLKKVFYADTPEFYTEREISTDSISANSLVVECGDSFNYLSYYNLFVYSNETLGATDMTYSEYSYYRQLFSSNEDYYDYYYSLIYDTTVYFNADYMLCIYIEYAAADIIPANYYLTGHGEAGASGVYGELGLLPLDVSETEIPADAASIFVNMPTEDITESERDALLRYLAGGGQLTFVTNEANLDMKNLCAVLAEYGMSAEKGSVCEKQTVTGDDGVETEESTTEPTLNVNTDNDVLYYLEGTGLSLTVKDANAIVVDEGAKQYLTVIPLLTSSSESYIGDGAPASYTTACAVETPDGAKIAWFTGGESFNDASTDAPKAVMYALGWVTLTYESGVGDVPATVYSIPTVEITSGGASLLSVLLILIPVAVAVAGGIIFYKRKKSK